jgi:hypothetical protein
MSAKGGDVEADKAHELRQGVKVGAIEISKQNFKRRC